MRCYVSTHYGTFSIIEGSKLTVDIDRETRFANAYMALRTTIDALCLPDGPEISNEAYIMLTEAKAESAKWLAHGWHDLSDGQYPRDYPEYP